MTNIRKYLRYTILAATWFILTYYGLDQTNGLLAAFLVLIGAVVVPYEWSKIWPAPGVTGAPVEIGLKGKK
jgi:hypothetical protein